MKIGFCRYFCILKIKSKGSYKKIDKKCGIDSIIKFYYFFNFKTLITIVENAPGRTDTKPNRLSAALSK